MTKSENRRLGNWSAVFSFSSQPEAYQDKKPCRTQRRQDAKKTGMGQIGLTQRSKGAKEAKILSFSSQPEAYQDPISYLTPRRRGDRGGRRTGLTQRRKDAKKTGVGSNVGYVKRSLSIDSARGIKSTAMIISETPQAKETAEHTSPPFNSHVSRKGTKETGVVGEPVLTPRRKDAKEAKILSFSSQPEAYQDPISCLTPRRKGRSQKSEVGQREGREVFGASVHSSER